MNITFSQVLTSKEVEQLAKIAFEVWHDAFKEILSPEQIEYMIEKFQSYNALSQAINQDKYKYYFIKVNNELTGYFGLKLEKDKIFLSKLYILKEYRGNKIATKVIDFIRQLAKNENLPSVYLTVNKYNNHAIDVYKHLGFVSIKDLVTDIGNGFVMDDYIFELYF